MEEKLHGTSPEDTEKRPSAKGDSSPTGEKKTWTGDGDPDFSAVPAKTKPPREDSETESKGSTSDDAKGASKKAPSAKHEKASPEPRQNPEKEPEVGTEPASSLPKRDSREKSATKNASKAKASSGRPSNVSSKQDHTVKQGSASGASQNMRDNKQASKPGAGVDIPPVSANLRNGNNGPKAELISAVAVDSRLASEGTCDSSCTTGQLAPPPGGPSSVSPDRSVSDVVVNKTDTRNLPLLDRSEKRQQQEDEDADFHHLEKAAENLLAAIATEVSVERTPY